MIPFRILALGGGGTKGFLHIGALRELEFRVVNLTTHFSKGVYGCSIGSILATGIAFGMNTTQMERLSKTAMTIDFVLESIEFNSLKHSLTQKGIFDMSSFETHVLGAFDIEGIDLRGKVLRDAQIPLNIIASNITKGVPTIFRGDVPVMDALKASCCIPIIFRPQKIGNSLYIDGGAITNILMKIIPKEEQSDTLAISLIHTNPNVSPESIETMSPTDFIYKLYKITCLYEHSRNKYPNLVSLYYGSNSSGIATPSDQDKDEMILAGRCIMRGFLSKFR